ncbi:MAG: methionyl-tRNA formyltransferase [Bacteroidales bacterium]|nr:methionyl-tRNA formyltransferase [Bacteroidales bacterium]
MNPKIVYMGTPEFAVAPLDALIEKGYDIVGVVTVPDKPSGRGLKLNESAVKQYAVSKGLKIMQPVSLKDETFLDELASLGADLFIVVAFRMLPKVVWSMPKMGTFNLHGSLLPQYRGAAPINWAIINGEKVSGVTTFLIDEKIDTGNILMREECEIGENENVGSLYERLMGIGANLVVKTVEGLVEGTLTPKPQSLFLPAEERERDIEEIVSGAPKLTKELCHIKWDNTVSDIHNLIRGLSPYPAAYSTITDGTKELDMKIYEAEPSENSKSDLPAGSVITDKKSYLKVVCKDGLLALNEIQLAGKKRMKVKDFLLGFRDIENCKFI